MTCMLNVNHDGSFREGLYLDQLTIKLSHPMVLMRGGKGTCAVELALEKLRFVCAR